ncbi:MAG: hypothetical protein IJ460_07400 [Clostridia bacterium]|nr:hypothetical protein [Clostridia bacterium]
MAVKTYQDSKDKYLKEKVDTFVLRVPKGKKDEIMDYAKSKGMSLNGYITELIFTDMGLETASKAEKSVKKSEAPKAENKPDKKAEQKTEKAKTAPKPVPEIKIPEPAPEVQEAEIQETEVKKKKMPSFLL